MEHRHIDPAHWSAAAVASALERGGLADWRELFAAVRADPAVAEQVLRVARQRALDGASILAAALVERSRPGLSGSPAPQLPNLCADARSLTPAEPRGPAPPDEGTA